MGKFVWISKVSGRPKLLYYFSGLSDGNLNKNIVKKEFESYYLIFSSREYIKLEKKLRQLNGTKHSLQTSISKLTKDLQNPNLENHSRNRLNNSLTQKNSQLADIQGKLIIDEAATAQRCNIAQGIINGKYQSYAKGFFKSSEIVVNDLKFSDTALEVYNKKVDKGGC